MSELITNYIYLYHIDKFIILPTYPQSIQDNMSANFQSTSALARSAPIFSYSNSGPRSMQISLSLHRDMMWDLNYKDSNIQLELGDDYIDTLIKQIQAIAVPRYQNSGQMLNPPMVALRFGDEIYIKGVVNGGISVTYSGPILSNNKYAQVDISFNVYEVDPYDADTIARLGSFRGISRTLERRLFGGND